MEDGCGISEPSAKRLRRDDNDDIVSSVIAADKAAKKHSLDSDEEEDEDATGSKYDLEDGVDGEEDTSLTRDGDIKLTPFNMKDEMNEGHFDRDGNYFWNKEVHVRDAWLDNLDEGQVPESEQRDREADNSDDEDDDDDGLPMSGEMRPAEKTSIYEQMLEMMKPKESVAKALRRLGGNRSSSSARWRARQSAPPSAELAEARRSVENLTGLANKLLTAGNMEVYQMTYEAISHQLKVFSDKNGASASNGCNPSTDMFGDEFEETKIDGAGAGGAENDEDSTEETWEYRSDGEDDSTPLQGPFTAKQMLKRQEDGRVSEKAVVRRSGTDNFYSARRVDFELYLD